MSPAGKDVSAAVVPHPAVTAPATNSKHVHLPVKGAQSHSHPIPSHPPTTSAAAEPVSTVKQFSRWDRSDLFSLAHEVRLQVERSGTLDILKDKVLCNLFYEPSTRRTASFDITMKHCGGDVIQVNVNSSLFLKGETLADMIRTVACYADAIVVRHPDVGSPQFAAKSSPVSAVDAGDGIGEHPTRALLDVYAIRSELGTANGRTIMILGDLKNGRTVHRLVMLLCHYSMRLNFAHRRPWLCQLAPSR
ncbi:Aspartate/ornithine carbamoyltransferase [Pisolithus croceorrhizus]|nr:Aspartate/ornithine carbamoyltransferase [Pisolithus croceorrhizus]